MGILNLISLLDGGETLVYTVPAVTACLACMILFFLFGQDRSTHKYTNLPIAGVEKSGYLGLLDARRRFFSHGHAMLKDAYHKYRGKNFVITTNKYDKVILTLAQVKELANAPDDLISFSHASDEFMMADYTKLDRFSETDDIQHVIRIKLTQNLGNMRDALVEEAKFAIDTEMPECSTDEWTEIKLFPLILRIVARLSGRAFIGLPLCRDEDWLTISIMFTVDTFRAATELGAIPKLIRPIYAYFWDSVKILKQHRTKAQSLLAPIVEKRLQEEQLAKEGGKPVTKYNDLLQWLIDRVEPANKTVDALTDMQLLISMAAIHTTNLSLVNTILDLAARPEYIQQIREEMESVLSEAGGTLARTTLRKMRKTDSFIKESLRTRLGLFSFSRKVMRSLTLSDGTYLRKGTLLAAPTAMFVTDPELLENPGEFDGFRWFKRSLETKEGSADGNYLISTSPAYLTFGHGKHACPGRFFATEEIKLLLVFLLFRYDIKYIEGQSRPNDIDEGEVSNPDPEQILLFKKLEGPSKISFL